jgi:acyl-CoA thioesterase
MAHNWEEGRSPDVVDRLKGIIRSPFARFMGIELVSIASNGEVTVKMDIQGKENSLGAAHGGTVFALADQAFAIAGNLGPEYQVAISASINYVRPGRGPLEATAILICETKSTSLYEAKVFQGGEMIALFQGTGYKLRKRPE